MKSFKHFLTEDIISVLDKSIEMARTGNIDQLPSSHINTLAALRVYVYTNNETDKGRVGYDTLVGKNISDADAIRALSAYTSNTDTKAHKLANNEVKFVQRLISDGKRDGHRDFISAIEYIKSRLLS